MSCFSIVLVSSVLFLVYHSGGSLWTDALCWVVFLHGLSVHFIEGNSPVVMVDFQQFHFILTAGALERVIAKRQGDTFAPPVQGQQEFTFAFMDGKVEFILFDMFSGIDTIIADLFEMLFRDMLDQPVDEIHGRQGFFHIFVIFMAVVMEGNRIFFRIVFINTGSGNDGSSEITANVFGNLSGVAAVWFCINVESVFMAVVYGRYNFPERRGQFFL